MIFTQALINGLVLGGIYLLMAVGFTLVFSVMRIVNFAHGEFFMLGGYAVFVASDMLGLPYVLSLLFAAGVVGVIGVIAELVVIRKFRHEELNAMIASLGLAIILQNVTLYVFGSSPQSMHPPVEGSFELGTLVLSKPRMLVLLASVAIFAGFWLVMSRTSLGRALRAVAQDVETARVQGVRTEVLIPVAFGVGAALAAAAGALMAPIFSISPFTGDGPMLKAFIVVILGGLGSIPGAAIGGLLLGLLESFASTVLGAAASDILQIVLVIAVLMFRPWGLFGQKD